MELFNQRKFYYTENERLLLIITSALTLIGLYLQFNIATSLVDSFRMNLFLKQIISIVISIIAFIIIYKTPNLNKILYKSSFVLVIVSIALLIGVLLYGETTQGSKRWISLSFFSFQPSQLLHPILIIFYAKYFDKRQAEIKKTGLIKFIKNFKFLIFITVTVLVLIYLQKHLSTLVVLCSTLLVMLHIAGFKKSLIIILLLLMIGGSVFAAFSTFTYRSHRMEIYAKYSLFHKALGLQKTEIEADDYQIRESLTAISEGGFFGTGSDGGRAKHRFLPDVNSDYIFSMISEQFGFLGGVLVIVLYTVMLLKALMISVGADSFFKSLVIIGMGMNIFITAIVNIGVSLSALPSTGLTLPFISYGGSALLVNMIMIAIILNFSSKRNSVNA